MIGAFAALLLGFAAFLAVKRLVFLMDDADLDQELSEIGGYLYHNPDVAAELLGTFPMFALVSGPHGAPKVTFHGEGWLAPPWNLAPEDADEQRRSFAYGNAHLANPNVTREMVDEAADRQPCNLGEHTCLLWGGHDGPCRNYAPLGTPAATRWRVGEYQIVERTESWTRIPGSRWLRREYEEDGYLVEEFRAEGVPTDEDFAKKSTH